MRKNFTSTIMSEGDVQPPKGPVVAEAHEVDTYRKCAAKWRGSGSLGASYILTREETDKEC